MEIPKRKCPKTPVTRDIEYLRKDGLMEWSVETQRGELYRSRKKSIHRPSYQYVIPLCPLSIAALGAFQEVGIDAGTAYPVRTT